MDAISFKLNFFMPMSRFASRILTERMYLFTLMPNVLRIAFCNADCEMPAAAARSASAMCRCSI